MKKIIYLMAMAIAAVTFTGCTDNNDDINLTLGQDGATEVTINRLGGVIEVPITCNGTWKASLPEDCDWARVITTEAKGLGKIIVTSDYYAPDNTEDRSTMLTVISGDKTQTIRVRQYLGLKDGENDGATILTDAWGETVLGLGCNIIVDEGASEDKLFKKNAVVSPENAKYIAANSMKYNRVFVSSSNAADIGEEGTKKENNEKWDTLGIRASVSVTYGLFKLKIQGQYKSNEKEVKNKLNYQTEYQAPRAVAWVGAADLASLATTTITRKKYPDEEEYTKMRQLQDIAVCPGFDNLRVTIMELFDEEYADSDLPAADSTWTIPSKIRTKLASLDTKYGPVYVSRVLMGGSTFLNLEYDSVYVADTLQLSGSIDLEITSGLLNVKAGVQAGYAKVAKNIMENSKSTFTVRGGDKDKRSILANSLTLKSTEVNKQVTKDLDINAVHNALKEWSASIPDGAPTMANRDLYAPISYGYSPVWDLFGDYAALVKEYFVRKYKNKNTIVNLEDM